MKIRTAFLLLLAVPIACRRQEPEERPVVAVKTAHVHLKDLPVTVQAPATIFGRSQANIASRITAPIRKLDVRKGEDVKAGQVLAILENRDLEAQQAAAAAGLIDAESSFEKTSKGTLPEDLQRARGELASSTAALTLAQKIYDRRTELFREGAISGRELQTSEAELTRAKADHDVAHLNLDLLEHRTGTNDIAIAQSRVAQAKAQSELAQTNLSFSELKSPMGGTITEQFMYPGDMARPDLPVFTVADLSFAVAHTEVPESEAGSIVRGQNCSFRGGDPSETHFNGKVIVVNQAVDPQRRAIEVWCEIPNPNRRLKAGGFGRTTIVTGTVSRAIVIPIAAVQFEEGTTHGTVYVVDRQQLARLRKVEAISNGDDTVRVIEGIAPDETVIIEGGYGLPDETKVSLTGDNK